MALRRNMPTVTTDYTVVTMASATDCVIVIRPSTIVYAVVTATSLYTLFFSTFSTFFIRNKLGLTARRDTSANNGSKKYNPL